MKKIGILLISLTLILSLTLTACGGNGGTTNNTPASNTPAESTAKGEPIKIGALTSLSGALQDYGEQTQRGFTLGLEYLTNGTMEFEGRPIEVIWEDTTNVPDVARERAIKLLDQDKVDILIGCASSSDAAAVVDVAEEFKKVFIIDPAAADSLTGENWNRYVFRTGRNSAQDAAAMAYVITKSQPGAKVATLAPDTTFGVSMVDPMVKELEERGGVLVHQEFPPADTSDFSPYIMRIREAQPDYLYVIWAGANNPWQQIMDYHLENYGIKITTGAPEIAALKSMKPLVGMNGFSVYHWTLPQNNEMNNWLVKNHLEKYGEVPDLFTPGGMAAASAIITALEKTGGNTDSEALIEAMEGMEYDSPTGKRYFRKEDHQSIQVLYEVVLKEVNDAEYADMLKKVGVPDEDLKNIKGVDYPVPQFVSEIPAEEIAPEITIPGYKE